VVSLTKFTPKISKFEMESVYARSMINKPSLTSKQTPCSISKHSLSSPFTMVKSIVDWNRCKAVFVVGQTSLEMCFRHNPMLFFGLCLFVGVWFAVSSITIVSACVLLATGAVLFASRGRYFIALLLVIASFFSTRERIVIPSTQIACQGVLVGEVMDRQIVTIHGSTLWKLQLYAREVRGNEGKLLAKGVTITVYAAVPCPLVGGRIYRINGFYFVDDAAQMHFRPVWNSCRDEGWTLSFVEWRVSFRRLLERIFIHLFPDQHVRSVGGALTFGLQKDFQFQCLMHRAGVEHVLAISGFHFGLVAALTLLCIQGIQPTWRACFAMVFLTAYLLIVGPLPSVVRSWWAAILALLSMFVGKKSTGLNGYGLGLTGASIIDPMSLMQMGCQLSFLATGAILLYSTYFQGLSDTVVSRKRKEEVVAFSWTDQVLTLILHRIFPAFSILIPVWCVLLPFQMAFMQDMSLFGMFYNLCIPLLFSLAMPCIILAVCFYSLPIIPHIFAYLGSLPLSCGMFLIDNIPENTWGLIDGGVFPGIVSRSIIVLFFLFGCVLNGRTGSIRFDAWKACI
jgi:competence protein ComEC